MAGRKIFAALACAALSTGFLSSASAQTAASEVAQSGTAEWANPENLRTYTTDSGLQYRVLREGEGRKPSATDVVLVNYEGRMTDGTVFDSSYERGEPISFPLNRVIAGWTEGVQLMPEGAVYEFYIPSELAYGKRGAGGVIPPDTDLIFKIELIEVK